MEQTWTIGELAEIAGGVLAAAQSRQPSGRVREAPNDRLIRWYATVGLVDPPLTRTGRIARYGRRHLLQLVAVKRRQAQGRSLAEIQAELVGATDRYLESVAQVSGQEELLRPPPAGQDRAERPAGAGQAQERFWLRRPAAATSPPAPAEAPAGVAATVAAGDTMPGPVPASDQAGAECQAGPECQASAECQAGPEYQASGQDQASAECQAGPEYQASGQNQAGPEGQAGPEYQASGQNQASAEYQASGQDQASQGDAAGALDQASTWGQAAALDQASTWGQAAALEQVGVRGIRLAPGVLLLIDGPALANAGAGFGPGDAQELITAAGPLIAALTRLGYTTGTDRQERDRP